MAAPSHVSAMSKSASAGSPTWNPERILHIYNPDSHGWSCLGLTQSGRRCRRPISQARCDNIVAILPAIRPTPTVPPEKEAECLQELAPLCLCYDHGNEDERDGVVMKWKLILEKARELFEQVMAKKDAGGIVESEGNKFVTANTPEKVEPRRLLKTKGPAARNKAEVFVKREPIIK